MICFLYLKYTMPQLVNRRQLKKVKLKLIVKATIQLLLKMECRSSYMNRWSETQRHLFSINLLKSFEYPLNIVLKEVVLIYVSYYSWSLVTTKPLSPFEATIPHGSTF